MHVIGITGGAGAGKSAVLAYLRQAYDAQVIQADEVAKDLQQKGQKVFEDIVAAFGNTILDREGSLDRQALAEIVFRDDTELRILNSIVHPAVKRRIIKDIEEMQGRCEYLFIEAALLIEEHYDAICEELWYIDTADDVRIRRLKESRGYSDEKIKGMFASQKSREEFAAACQAVIDNSGEFSSACRQIDCQMKRFYSKR